MEKENNFKDTVNSLFKGMDGFVSAKHMISAQQTYDCHCDHNKIFCNKDAKNHAHTNKKQHKTS